MGWGTSVPHWMHTRCSPRSCRRCLGSTGSQCPTNHNSVVVNLQNVKRAQFWPPGLCFQAQRKKLPFSSQFFFSRYWFCLVHITYRKSLNWLFRCTLAPVCILNMHTIEKNEKSQLDLYVQCDKLQALQHFWIGVQLMLWSYLNASNLVNV